MSRQEVPRRRTLNSPLGLMMRRNRRWYFSVKPGSNEGLFIMSDNRRTTMAMSSRARRLPARCSKGVTTRRQSILISYANSRILIGHNLRGSPQSWRRLISGCPDRRFPPSNTQLESFRAAQRWPGWEDRLENRTLRALVPLLLLGLFAPSPLRGQSGGCAESVFSWSHRDHQDGYACQ